ncbi:NF038215 family lipoprotein [Acinetobacter sp. ANC 4558]|uniref:NF038215 family lipoprotein n=1 Tax=Acinetobacter sp. ANC 4558 TaxID=1977876 RepID=UPI00148A14C1|nr:NF038215 family lipoprotein [Acinetobacter sp. ANC 4558]
MEKVPFILIILLMSGLVACDSTENFNKPKTDQRTMIIGGVPAFDQDYQLLTTKQVEK